MQERTWSGKFFPVSIDSHGDPVPFFQHLLAFFSNEGDDVELLQQRYIATVHIHRQNAEKKAENKKKKKRRFFMKTQPNSFFIFISSSHQLFFIRKEEDIVCAGSVLGFIK